MVIHYSCYNIIGDNMKIMFVSDVHGSKSNLKKVKELYDTESPDKIIFLGDLFFGDTDINGEIETLLNTFDNKILIRGNCDFVSDIFTTTLEFRDTLLFSAFNKRFFCSHGDVYNIHRHPDCNYDVLVFGHTHQGMIIRDGGRYYINPGSVSTPKADHLNSYLIVDDRGIFLKNFEQSIL